jgi:hypothetical protein
MRIADYTERIRDAKKRRNASERYPVMIADALRRVVQEGADRAPV